MRVRFGYVAISLNVKDCSPSKAVTATNLDKIDDAEARIIKMRKIAKENINNTLRILKFNAAHDIMVYRITSKLVPLATHPIAHGWNYIDDLADDFRKLGDFIKERKMRVSSHPDHFTLLNSPRKDVHEASLRDLNYHKNMFEAMGLYDGPRMVLHVGGLYGDKDASIKRFVENCSRLPDTVKNSIMLENDDKIYNAEEVLNLCRRLNMPMVLDVHHDWCNPSKWDIGEYIEAIFDTWKGHGVPPKIHFSSPKSDKEIRSHADFIAKDDFLSFLYKAKDIGRDFDVMIEAKQKDLALFKLMEDMKGINGITFINGAEIEI